MRTRSAALGCTDRLAPLALVFVAACALSYEDGAPAGHTGGFGEPDCTACHSDNPRNDPAGSLALEGLPERYAPGERYRFSIVLSHPELEAGGFQLAIRAPDGTAAGRLTPVDDRTRVIEEGPRRYLQHTPEGRRVEEDGHIAWHLEWQAPAAAAPLTLHLAANAANDDLSELGDFIFSLKAELSPRP